MERITQISSMHRSEERRVGSDWSSDVCSSDLTKTRPHLPHIAAIHHHERWFVIRDLAHHGAYYADIVNALADLREDLAHRYTALALRDEFERRWESGAGPPLGLHVQGNGLAGVFCEHGLRVECIYLRRSAVHEKVNDPFRLGRKLRRMRRQGTAQRGFRGCRIPEQSAQGERTEPHAGLFQ